jgi:hypothetical protein
MASCPKIPHAKCWALKRRIIGKLIYSLIKLLKQNRKQMYDHVCIVLYANKFNFIQPAYVEMSTQMVLCIRMSPPIM